MGLTVQLLQQQAHEQGQIDIVGGTTGITVFIMMFLRLTQCALSRRISAKTKADFLHRRDEQAETIRPSPPVCSRR